MDGMVVGWEGERSVVRDYARDVWGRFIRIACKRQ
jgi:hypothetical protein